MRSHRTHHEASHPADDEADIERLVRALGAISDLETFGRAAAEALMELIPGISTTYTEVDPVAGRAYAVIEPDPDPQWWSEAQAIFERFAHQHPVLQALDRDGDRGATTWDDVADVDQFRQTELYREFYAPLGIDSQLIAPLPAPEGVHVALAVNRGPEGFTPRDRAVLDVMRARLVYAYRGVQQRSDQAALQAALGAEGWQVVLVDAEGIVEEATSAEGPLVPGRPLPPPLLAAFRAATDPPHRLAGPPRRSAPVRVDAPDGEEGSFTALVVPNTLPPHVVLLRAAPAPTEVLRREMGLTHRQAAVAFALVDGSTNDDIARSLGISPATVKKHLEAVYRGLGVRSRSEAVAAVSRLLHPPVPGGSNAER